MKMISFASALLLTSSAFAQSTLGEVLDAGGRKLSVTEVKTLLTGASVSGPGANGTKLNLELSENGKASGYLTLISPQPMTIGLSGSWKVEEDGKVCSDLTFTNGRTANNCGYYFQAGENYFGSTSENDRSIAVFPRSVKK